MVSMLVVRDDGTIQRDASQAAVAQAWRDEQQLVWLDFDHPPNTDEQQFLIDLLDFNEGAIEHVTEPQKGPRAVRFRSYVLVVIYDVALLADTEGVEKDKVVLLVGDRFLVSVHSPKNTLFAQVGGNLEPSLSRFGVEIGAVAFAVLESIADHYPQVVEEVRLRVAALEERVLNHDEPAAITDLYHLRRELTTLRRVIAPEEALLGSRANPVPFAANLEIQEGLLDVKHTMQQAVADIDQYLSMLPDMLTTYEALKSDKLNRILKLLTVWSIILASASLFPGVLGISLAREPGVSPFVGYVASIGMMVLAGCLIWYFFKRWGWLE